MRTTPFALAALVLISAACSDQEPSTTLLVREAQAAPPPPENDYGWKTTPDFNKPQTDVKEYE